MSFRKAYIFGDGGHARVIATAIESTYSDIYFVSLSLSAKSGSQCILQEHLFAEIDSISKTSDFFIGIGDNRKRTELYKKLKAWGVNLPNVFAPGSFVHKAAYLADGIFVGHGAIILSSAEVNANCIVNTLSSVDHDCILRENVQLTAGVMLGGNCTIGEASYLGMRSTILPGLSLGSFSQVMAGSVVTKPFGDYAVVGGYPASVVKRIERVPHD